MALWTLDLAIGTATQLVDAYWIGGFEWSPDGGEIAYSVIGTSRLFGSGNPGIFVVSADGGTPAQLTFPESSATPTPLEDSFGEGIPPEDSGVQWLPDGGMVFVRNFNPNCSDCGSGQMFRLTAEGEEEPPAEGERVTEIGPVGIIIDDGLLWFQPTGSDERTLIAEPKDEGDRFMREQLSPDGKWLTYLSYNCGQCEYP